MSGYIIVEKRRAWWPVLVKQVEEDGTVSDRQIKMRFWVVDEDEMVDLKDRAREEIGVEAAALFDASIAGEVLAKPVKPSALWAAVVMLIADDWQGVARDNGTTEGEPLSWDKDNLSLFLRQPGNFDAVVTAFNACRNGERDIRTGN